MSTLNDATWAIVRSRLGGKLCGYDANILASCGIPVFDHFSRREISRGTVTWDSLAPLAKAHPSYGNALAILRVQLGARSNRGGC